MTLKIIGETYLWCSESEDTHYLNRRLTDGHYERVAEIYLEPLTEKWITSCHGWASEPFDNLEDAKADLEDLMELCRFDGSDSNCLEIRVDDSAFCANHDHLDKLNSEWNTEEDTELRRFREDDW